MKNFFAFLFSRVLWINLLIAAFVVFGLVFGAMHYLKDYTRHGEQIELPDFGDVPMDSLDYVLSQYELRYEVLDSVYSDAHERGTVVNQSPKPGSAVKRNRKIYLTVNATQPPMVTMRDMVGLSKRQAVSMLSAMGLEIDSLVYQPDICLDCVLEQRYKGEELKAESKLKKGEKITLVLGGGREGRVLVPDLKGLTFEQAQSLISAQSLVLGAIILCEGCETAGDTLEALVYKQIPVYRKTSKSVIPMGSTVDLYLTTDSLMNSNSQSDTIPTP